MMNQKTSIPIEKEPNIPQYICFSDFSEKMKKESVSPYKSELSFEMLLNKVKGKLEEKSIEKLKEINKVIDPLKKDISKPLWERYGDGSQANIEAMVELLFPAMFKKNEIGFISLPFNTNFVYQTPAMKQLMLSQDYEVKIDRLKFKEKSFNPHIHISNFLLNKYYKPELNIVFNEKMVVKHIETGLERHFRIDIIKDYIQVKTKTVAPELSDAEVYKLVDDINNENVLLNTFPPEDYSFEGFMIGRLVDVTESELIASLNARIVKNEKEEEVSTLYEELTSIVRSFLRMPDVCFGSLLYTNIETLSHFSWSIIGDSKELVGISLEDLDQGWYGQLRKNSKAILIGDLQTLKPTNKVEEILIGKGIRSLLLAPLLDRDGQLLGVFELSSSVPYRFTERTLTKLKEIIEIFTDGTRRFVEESNNQLALFIQKQYTSIHPSVEWKFQDVSRKYLWSLQSSNEERGKLEPIVFEDIYPIYGQADIVGSSNLRNQSIANDFIENLERVIAVMQKVGEIIRFHLLDVYLAKAKKILARLKTGAFVSSDESLVMGILLNDIHPLLRELRSNFSTIPNELIEDYFADLDPQLGILYFHRKNYEDSVSQLNDVLASYMEQEDQKMQKILPHFFEKYSTDGIEYNIYLGQSMLPKGDFSLFFLKDFRIWQLMSMCELTNIVNELSPKLPVPLKTAQLIFVYNSSMSIRFKMEEKQFDVDGTYNVRYEILKKRIDKATVKGTNERLTVEGKIAIVWLQEKDRQEYLFYLEHLISQGLIESEIEELELNKLQGAEGLKALRVTVTK